VKLSILKTASLGFNLSGLKLTEGYDRLVCYPMIVFRQQAAGSTANRWIIDKAILDRFFYRGYGGRNRIGAGGNFV
jgi:hypothetical protein